MANLAAVSQLGDSERGPAALARLIEISPLIRFLDQHGAFELDATDFDWRPEDGTTTVKTRALGGAYTASTQTPSAKQTGELAIHGDQLDIDISHIADADRGIRDLGTWIDKRLGSLYKSWAKGFEAKLIYGDHTATPAEIKGLHNIFDGSTNLPGFSITGVVDAASALSGTPDSFDLSNSANYDAFLELVQNTLAQVEDPRGIACNKELYARMSTIAREKHIRGEARDQFGRPVVTFDGVPLIKVLDGTITNTEDDNAATPVAETTSLDILSPGEQRLSIVTNSGLYFNEKLHLESKESGEITWEVRAQWKVEEKNAMRRIRNIKV